MHNITEKAPLLQFEMDRMEALYGYNLGPKYEKSGDFQHVVSMAAQIFNVPIAVVNIVGEKSVFAESSEGMGTEIEFERDTTICSQAILNDKVTVFRNARMEPCLASNPFVYGDFGLQFYAAALLRTKEGFNLGVLAIIDQMPRAFSDEEEEILESLAAIVMGELDGRKTE